VSQQQNLIPDWKMLTDADQSETDLTHFTVYHQVSTKLLSNFLDK
jgi:hypothetical protein